MEKENTTVKLKRQYDSVCNEWIELFVKKQNIEFDGWVGNEVGGIASFCSQYFFNLSDIIIDLTTDQPIGLILNWQTEDVDYNLFNGNPFHINYKSYTMGLRHQAILDKAVEKLTEPKND